ncbi:MAG: hypothetical protein Q8N60_02845 [Candidatus Diapherotrites archaeon]|nr:hypothetical protein [Candidatus Diapherotrites archaeon]
MDKRLRKASKWSNKLFENRKIPLENPAALDEKTRQLLSKPMVKRDILNYYSNNLRYYKELLDFAEKKGAFQRCILRIRETISIAEEDLARIKANLEQY